MQTQLYKNPWTVYERTIETVAGDTAQSVSADTRQRYEWDFYGTGGFGGGAGLYDGGDTTDGFTDDGQEIGCWVVWGFGGDGEGFWSDDC